MSDTPDVLDALAERLHQWIAACPGDGTCGSIACHDGYYTFIEHAAANDLLALFGDRGEAVVKAPGLSHGDELVRLGTTWSSLTGDPPPPPTYVLRRPVPENGDADSDETATDALRRVAETADALKAAGLRVRVDVTLTVTETPENGERPHTHTRGIDRGPECDAEYGDTDG